MTNIIPTFLSDVAIGLEQHHENLTIFPLLAEAEADTKFITLDEAMDQEALTITEISESGTVPKLRVVNHSGQKILLLDGEELVGAKQNRVLNVTILLAPHSETLIPVSCIEQGRWSYSSREFHSSNRTMNADLRKKKAQSVHFRLRETGSFASDQGEIWEEIDQKFARCQEIPSPTSALSDLFDAKQEISLEYLEHFNPVDKQIGLAVYLRGNLAGVEFLTKYDKIRQIHGKLITSYILDALEIAGIEETPKSHPSEVGIKDFLEALGQATLEWRASVALGEDLRISSPNLIGAGLSVEGQVLQLSLFPKSITQNSQGRGSSLRQASRRRNSLLL
jgi:hypothetical protein